MLYICKMEYYSAIKRKEIVSFAGVVDGPRDRNRVKQVIREKQYHIISLISGNLEKNNF